MDSWSLFLGGSGAKFNLRFVGDLNEQRRLRPRGG